MFLRMIRLRKMRSLKSSSTTKGSIICDTAISLPILILSISMLLSLLVNIYREDKAYADMVQDANVLSVSFDLDDEIDCKKLFRILPSGEYLCIFYRPFVSECTNRDSGSKMVYIYTKSGNRYHNENCSILKRLKDFTLVSIEDAEAMGYTPCELCKEGGVDYFKKKSSE